MLILLGIMEIGVSKIGVKKIGDRRYALAIGGRR